MMSTSDTTSTRPRANRALATHLAAAACGALAVLALQAIPRHPASDRADVLARVGERVITVADFEREAKRRGGASYYDTLEGRRALLDDMVRTEQLAARAEQLGYADDPDLLREQTQLLAGTLKRERVERQLAALEVSDAEIEAYYRDNAERFTIPAAARAALIFFAISPTAADEQRTATRARAEQVRAEAESQAPRAHFGALAARNSSDQASRYRGGDIGWLAQGNDPNSRWEPAVRDAIFALEQPGRMTPLLTTESGIYLIRLLDRKPAEQRPLAAVRDQIAPLLLRDKRAQRRAALYAELTGDLPTTIDEQRLADFKPLRPHLAEQPLRPPSLPQG